eukprot:13647879-Alexandrium_andersonii.AAC.1
MIPIGTGEVEEMIGKGVGRRTSLRGAQVPGEGGVKTEARLGVHPGARQVPTAAEVTGMIITTKGPATTMTPRGA